MNKINYNKILNLHQNNKHYLTEDDFVVNAKKKILQNANLFIDDNNEYTSEQKEEYKTKIEKAINLAFEVHKDQKPRPDGPYTNHILRVSNRIIEEYGIKDPELVMAALLHDSVEDQASKLAKLETSGENISEREKALLFINNNFGERVRNIVLKLTNPEKKDKDLPQDQKNKVYLEHVKEAIKDPDVLVIKLADFSDNALNLEVISDSTRRLKLSHKYLPVIKVFIEQLEITQSILSSEKITNIKNNLLLAVKNIQNFISDQEKITEILESTEKIHNDDRSNFNFDQDKKRMDLFNWQALLVNLSEIFSNTEFIKSIEEGKYNLLIADDVSARIPSLIFDKVIKEVYRKNDFPDPKLIFIPGQMRSTDPNISAKISDHVNKYLENVGLSNIEINALIITDVISEGRTIKKLLDALKKSNINCDDIAVLSFESFRDEKRQEFENLLGKKIYSAIEMGASGVHGVPYSHGVKKYLGEMVSRKIPDAQKHINQARQMVNKISERMLKQISGDKTTVVGSSEYKDPFQFIRNI